MLRDLTRSIAATSAARIYSLAVSVVMLMIVARWLGPSGQGVVAAATTWATLFATLGSLSLGQVAIHRATVRRGEPWLESVFGTMLTLAAIVTVGCWIVAAALWFGGAGVFQNIQPSALLVGFILVPFLVWEFYGGNLLMATDRIAVYNRAQLLGRTVGAVLLLVAWRLHLGVVAALAISVLAQVMTAFTGISALWHAAGRKIRFVYSEAKLLLSGAFRLHLNAISGYVYTSLGVLVVNHYRGAVETGLYQFTASLINVMVVIPLAASAVLSAKVASVGPNEAWAFQRTVFVVLPLLMIVACGVAAICAPMAILLVAGPKYVGAVSVFRLALLGIPGLTMGALMSSQWIGRGYFWQMSALSTVVAVVHLACNISMVPKYGMYGAVYANLVMQGISVIGNGVMAIHCEKSYRRSLASTGVHPGTVEG